MTFKQKSILFPVTFKKTTAAVTITEKDYIAQIRRLAPPKVAAQSSNSE